MLSDLKRLKRDRDPRQTAAGGGSAPSQTTGAGGLAPESARVLASAMVQRHRGLFALGGVGLALVLGTQQSLPNVWMQALDGSASRPLTRFEDGREILDFAWSNDGARLAVARSRVSTDIVMFRGIRGGS
jgi:citrate lyase alpha subunit